MLCSLQLFAHSLSKQEMRCNIPMSQSLTLRVEASVNALSCPVSALINSSIIETFARRLSGTAPEAGASAASQCCQWTTFGLSQFFWHFRTVNRLFSCFQVTLQSTTIESHPFTTFHLSTRTSKWSSVRAESHVSLLIGLGSAQLTFYPVPPLVTGKYIFSP